MAHIRRFGSGRSGRGIALACVLAALHLVPHTATAQDVAPLGEIPVFKAAANERLDDARVARAGNGDFVVVWEQVGPGTEEIFARRFAANGRPLGSAFQVNTTATGRQSNPDVAMNRLGEFVVVWESTQVDGVFTDVFAQRYDAGGDREGGEFRVNSNSFRSQSKPAVVLDGAGVMSVVFLSENETSLSTDVAYRSFQDGVSSTADIRVNQFTSAKDDPAIATVLDGSGDVAIAWVSTFQSPTRVGGSNEAIYFRRFDLLRRPLGTEVEVHPGTSRQIRPAIAANQSGEFLLVWEEAQAVQILGRRIAPDAVAPGGPVIELSPAGTTGIFPALAGNRGSDAFTASWLIPGSDSRVVGRRLGADGTLSNLFDAFLGRPPTPGRPDVAADADGDFVIANTSGVNAFERRDVSARRFSAADVDLAVSLSIDEEASGSITPDSLLVYRVSVDNLNDADEIRPDIGLAQGVSLRGLLRSGVTLERVEQDQDGRDWRCSSDADSYRCSLRRPLPAGQSSPVLLVEARLGDRPGRITHGVTVNADQLDGQIENNTQKIVSQVDCKLRLGQARSCVTESVGLRVVTVERVGVNCPAASVDFRSGASLDTAQVNFDYRRASGTLSWAANDQTLRRFDVEIIDDSAQESEEFLEVKLRKPRGTKIDGATSATIRIVDDDPLPPPNQQCRGR